MKISEISKKKDRDLDKFIEDLRGKLLKAKFNITTKDTSNHREVRSIRKDIAKALTVKRERSLVVEMKSDKEKK